MVASLSSLGCASLQDIGNTLFGTSQQKITRTPVYVYAPDLRFDVDGKTFDGFGVSILKDETQIKIQSLVHVDRIEVSTCSRLDVCQVKGGELACKIWDTAHPDGRFYISQDWFGNPGKSAIYHYVPDRTEHEHDACANMVIMIYDKNVLAAWGFLYFRRSPEKNFPAQMTCNATDWNWAGSSACAAKAGTIQKISFKEPVDNYKADESCGLKKLSDREFEFKPLVNWCRASFGRELKYHDVILDGWDEVLLRDGK